MIGPAAPACSRGAGVTAEVTRQARQGSRIAAPLIEAVA